MPDGTKKAKRRRYKPAVGCYPPPVEGGGFVLHFMGVGADRQFRKPGNTGKERGGVIPLFSFALFLALYGLIIGGQCSYIGVNMWALQGILGAVRGIKKN